MFDEIVAEVDDDDCCFNEVMRRADEEHCHTEYCGYGEDEAVVAGEKHYETGVKQHGIDCFHDREGFVFVDVERVVEKEDVSNSDDDYEIDGVFNED